nr:uncharacterized protein LOC104097431 [Nicotiana tomentosiformis]XP_009602296.1 uncharacterized protein LOC104097431 [Nicotiana tomentosiformis]XP_018626727.1 uncharacterized protein LOC104097431 [Nicotiana tomentosiformis]XP_033512398.1 uncharacterized protein LOC104097431 [Nicotiana tomentosiformis]XP_033512405.1 uncharacterized protein LOC104097431 [Nicotiana tomentosiformis]
MLHRMIWAKYIEFQIQVSRTMALSSMRNVIPRAKILIASKSGMMRFYHGPEEFHEESLPSEWYEKAFSKLTKLSHLLKNVDLVDGKLVNVNDRVRVYDESLEQKMCTFKSLARTFVGCPSMQERMKKNVMEALADSQYDQPVYFSKASERESITIDSLTKVSNFLNVSAQQKKLVRQSVCAQVTKYPIWTGALEEILTGLKSEIDFLNSRCPSKEIKMAQQIVATCQKFLESATSYDPESTSWMRLAPAKGAESPTSHKWEDVLEMFLDLINCLCEETKLTSEVKKLEVMKEGLYQIRDVLIDKSIGYKETRHQESLVRKKLSKTLGHSSRCVFTLLLYYIYGSIWDIEVEVCGGLYAIGRGDKFRLCMGKILTSNEQNILQSGVKQLSRVLGLFKFVWETAGMKGDLEVQGHLWCIGAENKSFTYRNTMFLLHSISC